MLYSNLRRKKNSFHTIGTTDVLLCMHNDMQGGGESRDQLYQRCTSTLLRIGRKHKGMILLRMSLL